MIELVAVMVEAADKRKDGSVIGLDRDKGRLRQRQLADRPLALVVLRDSDDGAAPNPLVGRRLVNEVARSELEAVTGHENDIPAGQDGLDFRRVGVEHDSRVEVVAVRGLLENILQHRLRLGRVGRDADEISGPR